MLNLTISGNGSICIQHTSLFDARSLSLILAFFPAKAVKAPRRCAGRQPESALAAGT